MEPVLVNIGANIRYLREQRGWTQGELAQYIGKARKTIIRLEAGDQNSTILLLCDVAEVLGIEVVDLFKNIS